MKVHFQQGVREGVAGWGEYQAIPIIIEKALWLQVTMAKVHTPPMMLYCYFRNQGCATAPLAPYFCCSVIEMLVFFLSHVHGMQYFTGLE